MLMGLDQVFGLLKFIRVLSTCMRSQVMSSLRDRVALFRKDELVRKVFNGSLIIYIAERQTRVSVIVRAAGESSESSTSLSLPKSVQSFVSEKSTRCSE